VAHRLAATEGLVLSDSHWQIIDLLRDFFERTETSPSMRPLVKLVKEQVGEDCGSSAYLMGLFGGSPAKTAAKIAGLPRPTNCL
jgi:tRNA 2-thiouridine synthesizing protein E